MNERDAMLLSVFETLCETEGFGSGFDAKDLANAAVDAFKILFPHMHIGVAAESPK